MMQFIFLPQIMGHTLVSNLKFIDFYMKRILLKAVMIPLISLR